MFPVLIAIVLLAASVAAIYLLLKSMGQDGVEVAAPGSCKSGRCGVPKRTANETSCCQDDGPVDATAETRELPAVADAPATATIRRQA